jgi:DNA-binding MarR family transcriptional regulator
MEETTMLHTTVPTRVTHLGSISKMKNEDDISLSKQRGTLRFLTDALFELREISGSMPVAEAQMLFTVALNEGASLGELAETAVLKKSTASRYLLNLSDRTRAGGEGYGVVSRETDPDELRRNMYGLTSKGRKIVQKITKAEG